MSLKRDATMNKKSKFLKDFAELLEKHDVELALDVDLDTKISRLGFIVEGESKQENLLTTAYYSHLNYGNLNELSGLYERDGE